MIDRASLEGLRMLLVADSFESQEGISHLGVLAELDKVKIREQNISDEAANWLCRQEAVKSLALTDTNASDSVLLNLSCKSTLRRLDLFRSDVLFVDERFKTDGFPMVRSLDVSQTRISGLSVEIIRLAFPRLERLLATETRLNDADLNRFSAWQGLKVLYTDTPGVDFDYHQSDFWEL